MKLLLPLLVFVILVVFLWRGLYRDPHTIPSPLINKALPSLKSQDFKGHVTLLNVFATWCLSCHTEHPILMDIANSHEVVVYGLDYKDNHFAVESWLNKYGNPYKKIVEDPDGTLAINLGVYGTPETFIIDSAGIIRDKYTGPITPQIWQNILLPEIKRLQKK
jgi:cytochrome c biogenesis protein CcmG/thiol:disulfide interchange protein DsbE